MRILLYESFSIYSCLNLNFLHFQIFYGIEKKILLGLLSAIHVTRAGMPLRKHVQFFFKKKAGARGGNRYRIWDLFLAKDGR